MPAVLVTGASAQRFFQRVVMRAMGYPRRGIPTTPGRHSTASDALLDRDKRDLAGHTTRFANWIAHPTDTELKAHPMTPPLAVGIARARRTLSATRKTQLDAIMATEARLGESWKHDDAIAGRHFRHAGDIRPGTAD